MTALQIRAVAVDVGYKSSSVQMFPDRVSQNSVEATHIRDDGIVVAAMHSHHAIAKGEERQTLRLIEECGGNVEVPIVSLLYALEAIETVVLARNGCCNIRGP
jgi:hypothetical protein